MKKFIALLVITFTACQAAGNDNPRNTLITAMARNDFGTVTKALEEITDMTYAEQQEYLQMADQIIESNIKWLSKHAFYPEIGKDSLKALGYYIATLLSGAAAAISISIAASTIESHYNENRRWRLEFLPKLPYTLTSSVVLAGLTSYLGYKTVQKAIDAWMKPSQRLENALRIRNAIFNHDILPILLTNDQIVSPLDICTHDAPQVQRSISNIISQTEVQE